MKIMLVNLPWEKEGRQGVRAGSRWPHIKDDPESNYLPFPFFLAYAAALLEREKYDVLLLDAICAGMRDEEFLKAVDDYSPDLLVVETSSVTLDYDVKYISRFKKGFKVFLCGPATEISRPDFLKENGIIDFSARGEYEFILLDLVNALRKNSPLSSVKGLSYRDEKSGKIFVNGKMPLSNINNLPWPKRDGLSLERYIDSPGAMPFPTAQMLASRGCTYGCMFCLWPQVMYGGRNYRVRDPYDVLDEMEELVRKYKFKSVYFDDDTFGLDRKWLVEFCETFIERNREGRINVPWAMMTRPDIMNDKILEKLKEAGLWAVKYGFESANQELVNNIGKNLDVEYAKKIIKKTHSLGIRTHLTFTFGLPGETYFTINNTIKTVLELDPFTVQFSITTPFPGTKYFDYTKNRGYLVSFEKGDFDGNLKSVIRTDFLSPADLERARKKAYRKWNFHKKKKKLKEKLKNIASAAKNKKLNVKHIINEKKKSLELLVLCVKNIRFVSPVVIFSAVRKRIKRFFKSVLEAKRIFFSFFKKGRFAAYVKLFFVVALYRLYTFYVKVVRNKK